MEGQHWSREEVEAIVADYLDMLTRELVGQSYNKSAHRRMLQAKIVGRSESSIEHKHQNISAVLIELGCPYISGYKPLSNYQSTLFDVVVDRLANAPQFDRSANSAADMPALAPVEPDFATALVAPPEVSGVGDQYQAAYRRRLHGVVRDYIAREARNRSLGTAGEHFVVAFERYRLASVGKSNLCNRVEHVAETQGDGLGFDVLSFEPDGRERFIEVKTTSFGKETPFYLSRNELEFSKECSEQFHLYRVFEFRRKPGLFDLGGNVQTYCRLDPVSYLVRFG